MPEGEELREWIRRVIQDLTSELEVDLKTVAEELDRAAKEYEETKDQESRVERLEWIGALLDEAVRRLA